MCFCLCRRREVVDTVTRASIALSAGPHPKIVSDRLGHASIAITLDTYSHVIAAVGEEAADKSRALFSATPRLGRGMVGRIGSESRLRTLVREGQGPLTCTKRIARAASSSGRAPDF
jgi:hypothetical protein